MRAISYPPGIPPQETEWVVKAVKLRSRTEDTAGDKAEPASTEHNILRDTHPSQLAVP